MTTEEKTTIVAMGDKVNALAENVKRMLDFANVADVKYETAKTLYEMAFTELRTEGMRLAVKYGYDTEDWNINAKTGCFELKTTGTKP